MAGIVLMPKEKISLQRWRGNIGFGLIDALRCTHALKLLENLDTIQFESPEAIKHRQTRLLEAYVDLVKHCCPLYKDYESFTQFPIIDKTFANKNRDLLLNPEYTGKIIRKKTGGSTGQPFVYLLGEKSQSYIWAGMLLNWKVAGYRLGEPVAFLAGSSLFGSGYKQFIYYKLMNVRLFSAFDMSADKLKAYADAISQGGFRLLYGYASAIHQLALHLLAAPIRPRFTLRGVVCTAEVLTSAMRETIESAFSVPCFNQYGCNDAGVLAYECEQQNGLHLITTRSYPEILEGGRLISTDMTNDAFFLPRYDTGDLVTMCDAPCPCGRGFPLIKEVVGRSNDLVTDQAGHAVSSLFFTQLFMEDARILQFQVVFDDKQLTVILHCQKTGSIWTRYIDRIKLSLVFDSTTFAENVAFVKSPNAKHRFVMRVADVESALAKAEELESL